MWTTEADNLNWSYYVYAYAEAFMILNSGQTVTALAGGEARAWSSLGEWGRKGGHSTFWARVGRAVRL
jgi:hypothetical protein